MDGEKASFEIHFLLLSSISSLLACYLQTPPRAPLSPFSLGCTCNSAQISWAIYPSVGKGGGGGGGTIIFSPPILGWSSICLSQVVKTTVDRRCSWGSPLLSALMATPVSILKQKVGFQSLRGKLFDVDTAFQAHVCPIASFSWSISWGWLHCGTKTLSSKPSRPSTCFDNYHLSV